LPVVCGGSLVQGTGLTERRYLFDNPKNLVFRIPLNIILF